MGDYRVGVDICQKCFAAHPADFDCQQQFAPTSPQPLTGDEAAPTADLGDADEVVNWLERASADDLDRKAADIIRALQAENARLR